LLCEFLEQFRDLADRPDVQCGHAIRDNACDGHFHAVRDLQHHDQFTEHRREAGKDPAPALEEIANLPLEKRYTWRVVSALKWAFADFDSACITVDLKSLKEEDRTKLAEALQFRPHQFCLMLKAILGKDMMERVMLSAVREAKG
jgi:thioesterase domain-containing protein